MLQPHLDGSKRMAVEAISLETATKLAKPRVSTQVLKCSVRRRNSVAYGDPETEGVH